MNKKMYTQDEKNQLGAMTSKRAALHVIKTAFIVRQISSVFYFSAFLFLYFEENRVFLLSLLIPTLCWPVMAYIMSSKGKNIKKIEQRNVVVDSFLSGIAITQIFYAFIPTALLLTARFASDLSMGGRKQLLKGLLAMFSSFILIGMFSGFTFRIETYPAINYLAVIALMPVMLSLGNALRSAIKSLSDSRKIIKVQNQEIQEQKKLIEAEHQRSENLLHNILPHSIAQRLKDKQEVIADHFDSTTILFADIVGFTVTSENLSPKDIVQNLNGIFSAFDDLVALYDLEKIKTIGDAYMVAGGFPEQRDDHVESVANLALEMQTAIAHFNEETGQTFDIRIGMHSGPSVAGVIGTKKFSYDVWGDSVNTAARMESHGIPGKIQVTQTTYNLLKNKFNFIERGEIYVKGKGLMKTYFLKSRIYHPEE